MSETTVGIGGTNVRVGLSASTPSEKECSLTTGSGVYKEKKIQIYWKTKKN